MAEANKIKTAQRQEKLKRIRADTAKLKKKFREKWKKKLVENLKNARISVDSFISNPFKQAILVRKWMALKDEFLEPPLPGITYIIMCSYGQL